MPDPKAVKVLGNFGAKVLPNATRIVLDCNDNQQEIINKNYPIARTIDFEPKKCSSVNISIIFFIKLIPCILILTLFIVI